jgi:hypothetical protein
VQKSVLYKIASKGHFLYNAYNAGIREDIYRPDDPFLLEGLRLALEGGSLSRRRSFLVLLFLFLGCMVRLLTRAGYSPSYKASPARILHSSPIACCVNRARGLASLGSNLFVVKAVRCEGHIK